LLTTPPAIMPPSTNTMNRCLTGSGVSRTTEPVIPHIEALTKALSVNTRPQDRGDIVPGPAVR